MLLKTTIMIIIVLAFPVKIHPAEQGRFLQKIELPSKQTAVVAEGEFEARSIGSFSVRLYEAAQPGDETTFFTAGLVCARDGYLERVMLADVDRDGRPEIVVISRSAGTGHYISAYAFSYSDGELYRTVCAEGFLPEDDPVEVLTKLKDEE
jgi:hypothetical protein